MREMLTGGELDVLTGDYLAELTMLILGRDRLKDPGAGYARTFLRQLEECLGLAHERGVRIVTNAGGLNPAGLADAVRHLADRLGIPVRVAHVEGDDLGADHPDSLTAHAYLGGFGIAACLREGADVVVTGRVTDAALVTGPAAAHFGWAPTDYDRLAGAVVAGHVLECGAQATGGNYAFFREAGRDVRRPGFPLAEVHADGSSVITKHPGTGGFVDVGTVTAQLLYETAGARYPGPDVTARLDTVRLTQDGPDRVRLHGVRGEAPPAALKVGRTRLGGFRNEVAFVLTGLDIEAKAALVKEQMAEAFAMSRPSDVRWDLTRTDRPDAPTEETASALLRLVVRDPDQGVVGRALSGAAVELALASYPGFHVLAPPGKGSPYGVFEAAYVPQDAVAHVAVLDDGRRIAVPPAARPLGADDDGTDAPQASPSGLRPDLVPDAPQASPSGLRPDLMPEPRSGFRPDRLAEPPSEPVPDRPSGLRPNRVAERPSEPVPDRPSGLRPDLPPEPPPEPVPDRLADRPPGLHPDLVPDPPSEPVPDLLPDPLPDLPSEPPPEPLPDLLPEPLPEPLPAGPVRRAPLGLVAGARSGDKGGDANVGVWARSEDGWRWLAHELTAERFQQLIPESRQLTVTRHVLPNLRALNFVVEGILGDGVAAQHRFDPQAKALGEWLRSRHLDIPEALL
ncbi:acyclic terpene utilization AtuA family protein [Streptomyces sp. NPDC058678]|uniref:acyclic terpene utilization AtuA family protein n=1 Tax=Streptomyces sp. NPDC058678 TaxID=3346595 RepID=UPI00364ADEF1